MHGWSTYNDSEEYLNNIIDPAVQYVINRGYYAIIDWHYEGNYSGKQHSWNDPVIIENTCNFWNHVASKYANHPNVIFEIFNEPGDGLWNDWQETAQREWVDLIRYTHNADNLIIVGGPSWSQVLPMSSSDNFFTGGNIVYSCHIYPLHISVNDNNEMSGPNWIEYTAELSPVMITEWGYENNSGANVTVGTTSGFGIPFKNYIDSFPNVGWTAWCFDYVYRSAMFDVNWNLLGNGNSTPSTRFHDTEAGLRFEQFMETTAEDTNENYMGLFVKQWLAEKMPEPMLGDVNRNGSITITDALMISQYYIVLNPQPFNTDAADVNNDSYINIIDALLISQYYVGLIEDFPAE